jgi:pSer/pThr/pTyr-binding forkhead associated (FHA) protein
VPRVFIKHQTGSKSRQTDMLDFADSREVLIGRDQTCALTYDENLDETVSRKHAKIAQNPGDPSLFTIENLSANGTFVNGSRIDAPTALNHGSTVKFGQSGPSFVFEIDPPPVSSSKLTVADFGSTAIKGAPKVSIKHQTGSKAPRAESLDFTRSRQVLIGRHPACAVVYDENRDETVSREQARIVQNSGDPSLFTIENVSRSNGTFVDDRKIDAPAPLSHGCVVRFGLSGPSFVFELDPPPSKATVLELGGGTDAKGQKKKEWWHGRATLAESLSAPAGRSSFGKIALIVAVALLVAVAGVGGYLYATRPRDSAGILEANGQAVVSIDATWRLFDAVSGRQAYHWYVPDPSVPSGDGGLETVSRLPVFVRMTDGGIEPVLILDDERDTNRAIAGRVVGSGCVVQQNGFILTGGPIAAPFASPYVWLNEKPPALLIDLKDRSISLMSEFPDGWMPSASRFVITRRTSLEDVRRGLVESTGSRIEGRLDAVSVGFSGSENRISAKLVGMSANNRLALFKVDPLQPLHSVALNDPGTRSAVADRAYLLGYSVVPGASKKVAIRLASVVKVPETAPGKATNDCQGCYQISESGTDAGFGGGPVFDDHGRLTGVLLLPRGEKDKRFEVVPIEEAADLLGLSQK